MSLNLVSEVERDSQPLTPTTDDLALLFQLGNNINVTANAGPTGNAILPSNTRRIFATVTCTNAAHGVQLPPALPGTEVVVTVKADSENSRVYPGTGTKINNGTASAPVVILASATQTFLARTTTDWLASEMGVIGGISVPTEILAAPTVLSIEVTDIDEVVIAYSQAVDPSTGVPSVYDSTNVTKIADLVYLEDVDAETLKYTPSVNLAGSTVYKGRVAAASVINADSVPNLAVTNHAVTNSI